MKNSLNRQLDIKAPIRAILDIGTNALKLNVIQVRDDGLYMLLDAERIVRLGEGAMESGRLQKVAMDRTIDGISELLDEAKLFTLASVDIYSTSILRTVENRTEFLERISKQFGVRVRILSEEEEAVAAYLAAKSSRDEDSIAILDLGGGSAEIAVGEHTRPTKNWSFKIGARRLMQAVPLSEPPEPSEIETLCKTIRNEVGDFEKLDKQYTLILIGGAAKALAGYARVLLNSPGNRIADEISMETISELVEILAENTLEQRKQLPGANPGRADVMVHAAITIRELFSIMGVEGARISQAGLGVGVVEAERRGIPLDPEPVEYIIPSNSFPPLTKKTRTGEVLFLLRRPDGKIWFQTKSTYPQGVYRIPGGGIDFEEAPGDTVLREIREETGFEPVRPIPLGIIRYKHKNGWKISFATHVYLMDVGNDEPQNQDPNEAISGWVAVAPDEFTKWIDELGAIEEDLRAWGIFRAAALKFTKLLHERGAW